jgi:AcrR family transcriptional regulator
LAEDGRARILDVAAELFLAGGYAGTSLREIAAKVGIKPASVYYHYASKEALLGEVLHRGVEVMMEAFERAAAQASEEHGHARLEAHVRAHLAALFEHGPYTAAHVTAFRTAPAVLCEEIVPERDAYEAKWSDLFVRLQKAGEIDSDVSIGLSRLTLFGAMNACVEWFDPAKGSLDAVAATITRQFWSGLASPSNRESAR